MRTNRPAATTSTTDNATCATTRPLATPRRVPSPGLWRASVILHRLHRRDAGGLERRRHAEEQRGRDRDADREQQHVPIDRQIQKDRTHLGRDLADHEAGWPTTRSRIPNAAPAPDSTTLSVNNCRTSRQRDAPSATRRLSSCRRAVARASRRLAMLAQAMISTSTTTTMIVRSGCS